MPDQVVAGCHSLHSGVRLHTSTDIQSLLHTQEHQSGSKQKQNQGTHIRYYRIDAKVIGWLEISQSVFPDHSGMAPFPPDWSASSH